MMCGHRVSRCLSRAPGLKGCAIYMYHVNIVTIIIVQQCQQISFNYLKGSVASSRSAPANENSRKIR